MLKMIDTRKRKTSRNMRNFEKHEKSEGSNDRWPPPPFTTKANLSQLCPPFADLQHLTVVRSCSTEVMCPYFETYGMWFSCIPIIFKAFPLFLTFDHDHFFLALELPFMYWKKVWNPLKSDPIKSGMIASRTCITFCGHPCVYCFFVLVVLSRYPTCCEQQAKQQVFLPNHGCSENCPHQPWQASAQLCISSCFILFHPIGETVVLCMIVLVYTFMHACAFG